ncbi:Site-specific DNA recombinase [Pseudobutyrivibrio sp. ACV-2]|uniref:recombinase family protein n=1 Tax=Pseudobutyrivibrio sp. ACV-2 TaxID=1520801 RepID=UPI000898D400|nr:recombinase family protein [Pseudobutyrivibrio sp. ACV-2]SEA89113.1 Site-specific DNA recombinase [Pseudobutyrivibrio sp. ACV-2]
MIKEDVKNRVYGYARCSTNESRQDIDRQKPELKSLGVTDEKYIYWEYVSGTKTDRVEFQKLLDAVVPGDTIVTTEVSRLTRSTKHLCDILQIVQDKKLKLVIGSFVVDCTADEIDPMTKGMLMMWGVFSEMERDIISQRVKSGMENARANGHKIGRPKLDDSNLPEKFLKYYPMYKAGSINVTDFANLLSCSRTTIYKYIALKENK